MADLAALAALAECEPAQDPVAGVESARRRMSTTLPVKPRGVTLDVWKRLLSTPRGVERARQLLDEWRASLRQTIEGDGQTDGGEGSEGGAV